MKTTLHPITVRDLYAGFADRGNANTYDHAWTSPDQDLWPPGVERPDGFFYDYGGGIVLLLFLLGAVVNEIVRRRRRPSVNTKETPTP